MKVLDPTKGGLPVDIVQTAYMKADPAVQGVVSAILTSDQDETSWFFSYILNDEVEELLRNSNLRLKEGFTYVKGKTMCVPAAYINAASIFNNMEGGREMLAITLASMVRDMPDDVLRIFTQSLGEKGPTL